ncbi:hypothetical protein G6F46_011787 [Rhizopus delemar]|nr:hypothetical protein G6F46_011787 [Rhizopus delemar]
MASRLFTTALRTATRASRLFTTALRTATRASRPSIRSMSVMAMRRAPTAVKPMMTTQIRGLKTLDFGGTQETVYERSDVPKEKLLETFKDDTIAVLGYGPQGRGQALNLHLPTSY